MLENEFANFFKMLREASEEDESPEDYSPGLDRVKRIRAAKLKADKEKAAKAKAEMEKAAAEQEAKLSKDFPLAKAFSEREPVSKETSKLKRAKRKKKVDIDDIDDTDDVEKVYPRSKGKGHSRGLGMSKELPSATQVATDDLADFPGAVSPYDAGVRKKIKDSIALIIPFVENFGDKAAKYYDEVTKQGAGEPRVALVPRERRGTVPNVYSGRASFPRDPGELDDVPGLSKGTVKVKPGALPPDRMTAGERELWLKRNKELANVGDVHPVVQRTHGPVATPTGPVAIEPPSGDKPVTFTPEKPGDIRTREAGYYSFNKDYIISLLSNFDKNTDSRTASTKANQIGIFLGITKKMIKREFDQAEKSLGLDFIEQRGKGAKRKELRKIKTQQHQLREIRKTIEAWTRKCEGGLRALRTWALMLTKNASYKGGEAHLQRGKTAVDPETGAEGDPEKLSRAKIFDLPKSTKEPDVPPPPPIDPDTGEPKVGRSSGPGKTIPADILTKRTRGPLVPVEDPKKKKDDRPKREPTITMGLTPSGPLDEPIPPRPPKKKKPKKEAFDRFIETYLRLASADHVPNWWDDL